MKLHEFLALFGETQNAIRELMSRGLLPVHMRCECGQIMHEINWDCSDGSIFRCQKKACGKKRSIRHGSFFAKSKLPIVQQVLLMHLFAKRYPEQLILDEYEFSSATLVDWFRYFREVCVFKLEEMDDEIIGRDGVIVEIDESVIVKRKYDRGRVLRTQWMFGAVERRGSGFGRCFVVLVENRSEETLLDIICRKIHPGSRIISDGWRAYRKLTELGFSHDVIIHEREFVSEQDPSIHTQSIESLWSALKRFLRQHGTNRSAHNWEYICEFIYRRLEADCFEAIMRDLKVMYA